MDNLDNRTTLEKSAEFGMVENTENLSWQESAYFHWNLQVFNFLENQRVLEIGCGPGAYYETLLKYNLKYYLGLDYSEVFLNQFKKRIVDNNNHRIAHTDLIRSTKNDFEKLPFSEFDCAICFDVIEHLEDDLSALVKVKELLQVKNCNKLYLRVPALQSIYGVNDKAIGHYRRYSKSTLKSLVLKAGFKIEMIHYQNLPGILPWYYIGNIKQRTLAATSGERGLFDRFVPWIAKFEKLLPPPVGLSVYCEARL